MADIFLSYNEKDRDVVQRLAETLRADGLSVWWDRRIPTGDTWRRLLERELRSMRCMVVVWSRHSVESEWVCEEATEGRLLGCLIPVRIDAVRPPAGFREIQTADLAGWDGTATSAGLRTLVDDIRQKIANPRDATLFDRTATRVAARIPPPDAAGTSAPIRARWWPARALTIVAILAVAGIAAAGFHRSVDRSGADPAAKLARGTNPWLDAGTADQAEAATPAATPTATTPPAIEPSNTPARSYVHQAPAKSGVRERCADLRQRFSLGETPSAEALAFLQKECGK